MESIRKTVRSFQVHMRNYIILFLMILLVSPALYHVVQARILEGEAHSAQYRINSQAVELAAYIQTIDSKLAPLISNATIKAISYYTNQYALADQFDFFLLIRELKGLMPSFTINEQVVLDEYMLFFPNSQLAFSSSTMYKRDYLAREYLKIDAEAFDAWMGSVLASGASRGWYKIEGASSNFYLYTRRMTIDNNNPVVAVYFFNAEFLRFGSDAEALIYLAAANGQNLSPYANVGALPDYESLAGVKSGSEIRLSEEKYLCDTVTSAHRDYRLVLLTPHAHFYALARGIGLGLILIIAAILLSIVLLAVGDYRKRRSKLDEVQKILADTQGGRLEPDIGYSVLKESISKLLAQNQQIKQELAHYDVRLQNSNTMMRKSILRLVVTSRMNVELTHDQLSEYGIEDGLAAYQVAILQFQPGAQGGEAEAHIRRLMPALLDSVLTMPHETFELTRNAIGIFAGYPDPEGADSALEACIARLEEGLPPETHEGTGLRIGVFIGGRVPTLRLSATSYYEASYLLETADEDPSRFLSVHVMDGRIDPMEHRLAKVMLLLEVDSREACMHEIRTIFDEARAVRQRVSSEEQPFSLAGLSLKLVSLAVNQIEKKPELKAVFGAPVSELEALKRCRSEEDIIGYLLDLYGRLYDMENPETDREAACEGKRLPMNQVLAYVHANYQDAMLTQAQIASEFGVSPSSLSVQFKRAIGVNITGYIASIRVEEVKQALEGTQEVLAEIAEHTGFNSVKTMIRIFKKVEGMTPGAYRRMVGGEDLGEESLESDLS